MFKDLNLYIKTLTVTVLLLLTEGNTVLGSQSVDTFSRCSSTQGIGLTANTNRSYKNFTHAKSNASLEVFKLEKNSMKPSTNGETFELKRMLSKINVNFGGDDKKHNLQDEFETDLERDWGFDEKAREDGYKLTDPWQNPYSVAIVYTDNGDTRGVCTGSLLTLEWVISAAHCFSEIDLKSFDLNVIAGSKSVSERHGSTVQVRKSNIKYVHIHPKYNGSLKNPFKNIPYDIALVKVPEKFIRTKSVDTIELSQEQWIHKKTQECWHTGFGTVFKNKSHPDDYKRKTNILVMSNACKCLNDNDDYMNDAKKLCNVPREDYGCCPGDSGGGLICKKLTGVASVMLTFENIDNCTVGIGTVPKCGSYNTLSIFCSTYPHLGWINSIVYNSANFNFPLKAVLLMLFSLLI